ncbi:hypothetical protein ACOSQ4_023185 [Xanthoceras sorbifolium]
MKEFSRSFKIERACSLGQGRSNGGSHLLATESVSTKVAGNYRRLSRSMRLTSNYESDNYNENNKVDDEQHYCIEGKKKKKNLSFRFISKVFSFSKKNNNTTSNYVDDGMRERLDVNAEEIKKKKKRFSMLGGGR